MTYEKYHKVTQTRCKESSFEIMNDEGLPTSVIGKPVIFFTCLDQTMSPQKVYIYHIEALF
jgi:hypothetical protein